MAEPFKGEARKGGHTDEVVEDAEAVWVFAVLDIEQGADLGGCERDVLVPKHDLGQRRTDGQSRV